MSVTIDAGKLRRQLQGKYGGQPDKGDHLRFYWWINGKKYGGAKISHGKKKRDLPDFVASNVAAKLNVSRAELKDMETCRFGGRKELEQRLVSNCSFGA